MQSTRTFKQIERNNRKYNFLDLPGTNYFKFEIVNMMGSDIEKYYESKYNKNVYGLSHLVEHLSFRSTLDYTSEELMELLKTEGTYNASTDYERINYWYKTVSSNAKIAINLVFNAAFNNLSKISKEEFEIERKVVYNEAKRYMDDSQHKFHFDSSAIVRGYNKEDTVVGVPETIENFELEDAIRIKDIFLQNDEVYYNISYDSKVISQDEILTFIENESKRFEPLKVTDKVGYDKYISFIKYPKEGEFQIENDADQAMLKLEFDAVFNSIVAEAGNTYLLNYSKSSLNDIIREKHGLTYGVDLFSYDSGDKSLTQFYTDVSRGDENLLLELFENSIDESVSNWNKNTYKDYMKTQKLKREMSLVDASKYEYWHYLAVWHPNIIYRIKNIISEDLDKGYIALDNLYRTQDKIEEYIKRIQYLFKNKKYSKAFN